MPTFNQLVRKGRPALRSLLHLLCRGVTTPYRRRLQRFLLHRSVVCVQLLRQLPLRSLTQHSERLPEYVFPMASKLQATFQEKVTTFRSIVLF